MSDVSDPTCEEFFLERIAPVEATAEDYRELFDLLWQAHARRIFQHAYSWLRDLENARDVCQDTFLRAMQFLQKHPKQVPAQVNFSAWLRVIARNVVRDWLRREARKRSYAASALFDDPPVEQSPSERVIRDEDLAILRRCIEQLSQRARTVVLLRDVQDMSEKDIAAQVGSNANAVCVALHRARRALRKCVELGADKKGNLP